MRACHYTYQSGLDPMRSWNLILDSLSDYFGDNASLHPENLIVIRGYMKETSADYAGFLQCYAHG
jgi:hypothetical protein